MQKNNNKKDLTPLWIVVQLYKYETTLYFLINQNMTWNYLLISQHQKQNVFVIHL